MTDADTFLYFAYGSNMSLRRLRARTPSARLVGVAELRGYRLVFDKRSKDGSAKADCEKTGNADDRVLGGMYRIGLDELQKLRQAEGAGKGYEQCSFVVSSGGGSVETISFIATDKDPCLRPYSWCIRHIIESARELKLPEEYLLRISSVAATTDPKGERELAELSIYSD